MVDVFASHCGLSNVDNVSVLFTEFLNRVNRFFSNSENVTILRNASVCISQWIRHGWIGNSQFEPLYSFLLTLLKMPSLPIHESLDLFYASSLDLLGNSLQDEAVQVRIKDLFLSFYSRGSEEYQTNGLFVLQVYFEKLTSPVDLSPALHLIQHTLISQDAQVRKYSLSLLNAILRFTFAHVGEFACFQNVSLSLQNAWKKFAEHRWELFISIYQTIDEFATHLLKSVWNEVWSLQNYDSFSSIPLLRIDTKWIEVLFQRALRHSNPQVRLFVMSSLFSKPTFFQPDFFVQQVLPLLNDNLFYKGTLWGVGFQLTHFLQAVAMDCTKNNTLSHFCRIFIHAINTSISNPSAYQFLLGLFDSSLLPSPPHFIHDDINALCSSAETLTYDLLQETVAFTLQWSDELDDSICEDLRCLLDRISTQVSYVFLLSKIRKTVLHILFHYLKLPQKNMILAVVKLLLQVPSSLLDGAQIRAYLGENKEILWKTTRQMFDEYLHHREDFNDEDITCLSWLLWLSVTSGCFNAQEIQCTNWDCTFLHLVCRTLQWGPVIGCEDTQWLQHFISIEWTESIISQEIDAWDASNLVLEAIEVNSQLSDGSYLPKKIAEISIKEMSDEQLIIWSQWVSRNHSPILATPDDWLLGMKRIQQLSASSSFHFAVKSFWLAMSRQKCFDSRFFSPLLEFLPNCDDELLVPLLHFLLSLLPSSPTDPAESLPFLSQLVDTIAILFSSMRGNQTIRSLLAMILTNDVFFRGEVPHKYHSLVSTILKNMTTGGISLGSTFVPLFLAQLRNHVTAANHFIDELLFLLMMKEPREELAITKTIPAFQPRVLTLQFMESLIIEGDGQSLFDIIIPRLLEHAEKLSSSGCFVQNSEENGSRLRCWQALCVCARSLSQELVIECFPRFLRCIVQLNLRDVRQYEELFGKQLLKSSLFLESEYSNLLSLLRTPSQAPQAVPSLLQIAVYPLLTLANPAPFVGPFLEVAFPWTMAPEGLTRTIAQVTCFEVMTRYPLPSYQCFYQMLAGNPRITTMRRKQAVICARRDIDEDCSVASLVKLPMNNLNDFIPTVIIEEVRLAMEAMMSSWYKEDFPPTHSESKNEGSVELQKSGVFENFQKKILPWEECSKAEVGKRRKQSIIVVASLVDKLPNLGGLTRTSEIFAIQKLVVNSLKCRSEQAFKSVSI